MYIILYYIFYLIKIKYKSIININCIKQYLSIKLSPKILLVIKTVLQDL